MKLLMVLDREFPFDERVEKEARSLLLFGHEVHLAAYTFDNKPSYENIGGIHVHRKKIRPLMFKLSAACLILPFYFWFWKKFIANIYQNFNFEVIHIHDLPLSKIGYYYKRKKNVKLVCDQHEYYSNWIIHTAHYNRGIGKLINRLSNWEAYEKKYLHCADLVITVEEPLREVYLNIVGLDSSRVISVPNTPDLSTFNKSLEPYKLPENLSSKFNLIYAGGIDSLRGLELVLEAIAILRESIPNINFLVAGKEQKGYSLKRLAEAKGVADSVFFVGWLGKEELAAFFKAGQIGIFTPELNREEIHRTIATKIYQYCAAGLPVLISKARMMEEFVERNKIGFSINSAQDFAERVVELQKNKSLYDEMSSNGLLIAKDYSWDKTVSPLTKAYEKF